MRPMKLPISDIISMTPFFVFDYIDYSFEQSHLFFLTAQLKTQGTLLSLIRM